MNFVADESTDQQIVNRLRKDGHDVLPIAETSPGVLDDEVLNTANREAAILLTADKDFGELVFRQGRVSNGVILVRLAGLRQEEKAEIVASAVKKLGTQLRRCFAVVSPGMVRIRRLL